MGNIPEGGQGGKPLILGIALVICRHPISKKYLAVHETNDTWWVAGGRVDAPESFLSGAVRQCQEEAGIDIQLKGILRIEQSPGFQSRLKIVFYGQPKNSNQIPKKTADKQSLQAAYFSLQDIMALKSKWRGPELYQWADYVQRGGAIYDLSVLRDSFSEVIIQK